MLPGIGGVLDTLFSISMLLYFILGLEMTVQDS